MPVPGDDMPLNDHDMLHQMWPRLGNVEKLAERLQNRQDKLEDAVSGLKGEMAQTREELSKKLDEGLQAVRDENATNLSNIELHLTQQDETLGTVREKVAEKGKEWPRGAIIFVSISGTFAGGLLVTLAAALINHWFH